MENKACKTIRYFGYGANTSSEMMKAIIGRKPSGFTARLEDYELWIQSWQEIPFPVRKRLKNSWAPDFRTYCISHRRGKKVKGHVWFLTPEEHQLVRGWEFWYQPIKIRVRTQDGRLVAAETEMVKKPSSYKGKLNGECYKFFLNNKKRMLRIAKMPRSVGAINL